MNWAQLSYQYIVGGIFFFVTVYLCFRPGGNTLKNPSDRRSFIYLMIGFFGYLAFHTVWIILARLV